ncbi:MAG: heparan-alpha-glucosaminide N-acetyltransferase domain-containing protein [Christensenellales bacterium]
MTSGRDESLDLFKGALVILMTYCHILQFFGAMDLFPVERTMETLINLLVFPGFLFSFGAASSLAYHGRSFKEVWPRMLRSALRMLGAFYLSGIAFRVLRENKPFASGTVLRILLLEDVPGWSEFLAAFAMVAFLGLLLFLPLRWLKKRPLLLLPLSLACLALCWLPYARIQNPLLRLLLGTTAYAAFPALPYFPYYLAGLACAGLKGRAWRWPAALALLCTGAGLLRMLSLGRLPERFPPDWGWILLPAAGLALLYGLARLLARLRPLRFPRLRPLSPLIHLGRNSLYYLLAGNLALFTLSGKQIAPQLKFRAPGLFGQPIGSPLGALWWTMALLLSAAFLAGLVQRSRRPENKQT